MPLRFDRSLNEINTFLGVSLEAEKSSALGGWLQRADPRAKLIAAASVLAAAALVHETRTLLLIYLAAFGAAVSSHLNAGRMLRREWLVTAIFTGTVALPSLFAAVSPGRTIIPFHGGWAITESGLSVAGRLVLRAVTSVHVVLTLTQTTPWHRVLRGLRGLGLPAGAVMGLALAHRYVYLLLQTASEMLLGREARRVGRVDSKTARRQITGSAGALMLKSQETASAVTGAMLARGFRGEARELRPADWTPGDAVIAIGAAALSAAVVLMERHAGF